MLGSLFDEKRRMAIQSLIKSGIRIEFRNKLPLPDKLFGGKSATRAWIEGQLKKHPAGISVGRISGGSPLEKAAPAEGMEEVVPGETVADALIRRMAGERGSS